MTEPQILTSVTLTGVPYLVKNVYKQGLTGDVRHPEQWHGHGRDGVKEF